LSGNTALHIAASQGHLHVLFTLVKLGAATNVRNGRGETPKELLKGTSTTANYDMEIFKGISLVMALKSADRNLIYILLDFYDASLCFHTWQMIFVFFFVIHPNQC
jgi:ankyrin repeat protein